MRRSALTVSAGLHAMIFILAVTGLPFLMRHEFVIPPPVTVDLVDISKVTETNRVVPQPAPPKEIKKEEKPAPAPKNTAKEAAVPIPKEKPEPEKKEVKNPAQTAREEDPNAPPKKVIKKPKTEEAAKPPPKDFSAVLKNLADQKDTPAKAAPSGQNAPLGQKMTMSEEDAVRNQLERCWDVPFGAKDAENMAVDIFMVINPDRTLREARIVDQARYASDTFFRAAADSALRAVRNPLCSPFQLPPDKYDVWNRVTVTFNPKDMF